MPFLFTGSAALRPDVLRLHAHHSPCLAHTQKKALLRQRLLHNL
jgi:hypothetical protein